MRNGKVIPEFWKRSKAPRAAGFIPNHDDGGDVELLQIWCRDADGDNMRRARTNDLRAAGFVKRKSPRRKP